jgi:hypothetical protein
MQRPGLPLSKKKEHVYFGHESSYFAYGLAMCPRLLTIDLYKLITKYIENMEKLLWLNYINLSCPEILQPSTTYDSHLSLVLY